MNHALTFGVYPFGLAAGPDGVAAGAPDDWPQIRQALDRLRGSGPSLLTRAYVAWAGPHTTTSALGQISAILSTGLTWDLVLAYRDRTGDLDAWRSFVNRVVRDFGRDLSAVQVTGEANLSAIPAAGDGAYPRATDALVHGIIAAARTKRDVGASADIGFAVVPDADPTAGTFWSALATGAGRRLADSVDYVGLDMYPDVFGGPVPLHELDGTVKAMLRTLREVALPIAGIGPATPIRICETGWPTGPGRSEQRQAEVLDTVLRSVHRHRQEFNVTHWELFTLRDADSSHDDPFHQFGVLHDDYTPKPAFDRLCRTITELTTTEQHDPLCEENRQ